jgi:hypothetical protein
MTISLILYQSIFSPLLFKLHLVVDSIVPCNEVLLFNGRCICGKKLFKLVTSHYVEECIIFWQTCSLDEILSSK